MHLWWPKVRLPSLRNATLTKVAGQGFSADYDRDATAGSTKWTGSEGVFWSESEAEISTGSNQTDIIVRRSLVVDSALEVTWATDDVVTVTYLGAAQTGIVQSIKKTTATGLPGVIRLLLDDA